MPRVPIPASSYTFPKGKPISLILLPVLGVMTFLALAVRWILAHGSFGWEGVILLVGVVVVFGFVDYQLLRFYEKRGRAIRLRRDPR
jgi:hypothetical protein